MSKPPFDPNAPYQPATTQDTGSDDEPQNIPAVNAKPAFNPNAPYQDAEDVYGTPVQRAITTVEQTLSGATLGASKVFETKVLGVPPQDIEAREQTNKINSVLSNIFGTGAMLTATGGLGGLAEGAGVGAKVGLGALEGAGIGGITQANDDWSQNKALDAQKIAASAGIGGLLGAAGTGLVEGIKAIKAKLSAIREQPPMAEVAAGAASDATSAAESSPAPGPVVDIPAEERTGVQPTDLESMIQKIKDGKYAGTAMEMPQKAVLQGAISRIPMENPVNPLQMDSLTNQTARDTYQTFKEMPGEIGTTLTNYEALQKAELNAKTDAAIKEIAPGIEPTSDAAQGGKSVIDAFTDQYQKEQKEISTFFEKLKQLPYSGSLKKDTIESVLNSLPQQAGGIFKIAEDGSIGLKRYTTSLGIDRATYNAVEQIAESLNDDVPETFQKLWDIRKGIAQNKVLGQADSELIGLKKGLMDQMQNSTGDNTIREMFKRYAINEQNRGVIERTFGASVGSPEFGALSKVKPELIGDKIFSNSANVTAAKNILGPDEFNKALANWISEARAAATDKGVFSSNKFGSFLRRNQDALKVAFDKPEQLQRLQDINTISRILPDAASVNPSGTAKTLLRHLSGMKMHDMTWEGVLASVPQKILEKVTEMSDKMLVNKALAGQNARASAAQSLRDKVAASSDKIESGVNNLFKGVSD